MDVIDRLNLVRLALRQPFNMVAYLWMPISPDMGGEDDIAYVGSGAAMTSNKKVHLAVEFESVEQRKTGAYEAPEGDDNGGGDGDDNDVIPSDSHRAVHPQSCDRRTSRSAANALSTLAGDVTTGVSSCPDLLLDKEEIICWWAVRFGLFATGQGPADHCLAASDMGEHLIPNLARLVIMSVNLGSLFHMFGEEWRESSKDARLD